LSDIIDVKRALASRAQSVAEMLVPDGKKESSEWRAATMHGGKGQSFAVHLTGNKAGIWSDFSTGEAGDLLDLWCGVRGLKLVDALDQAREYLGMRRPQEVRDPSVPRKTFKLPPKPKCTLPKAKALDYLCVERNITPEAVAAYKVGEQDDKIVFPFMSRDGSQLILAKARTAGDNQKPIPTAKDCAPTLMGWHLVPDGAREINIVEGEIDALSLYDYGRVGLSVPFGGGKGAKQDWIDTDFDMLQAMERINLVLDDDKVGDEACEEISGRLGRHRCYRVKLPRKDANQCLLEGVKVEEINKAFEDARTLDPEELVAPSTFTEEVIDLFWPKEGEHIGYRLPYDKIGNGLLFRPGEMTLWSGSSGSGKSQILSDSMVDWVNQGARTCVLSLEMKGKFLLARMVKQASKLHKPTSIYITKTLQWLDEGLWVYNLVGKVSVDSILEVFDYARARHGCDTFVIDSLMRVGGVASDDYSAQEELVYKVVTWCGEKDVHVHLVAHSRKGEKARGVPETDDVKGAMEIGANAFNIISVWRNRKLEEEIADDELHDDERAELLKRPGVIINVCKNRNADFEGKVGLWFDQVTYRYRSSHDSPSSRDYTTKIEGGSNAAV
jgi:twinkle protein